MPIPAQRFLAKHRPDLPRRRLAPLVRARPLPQILLELAGAHARHRHRIRVARDERPDKLPQRREIILLRLDLRHLQPHPADIAHGCKPRAQHRRAADAVLDQLVADDLCLSQRRLQRSLIGRTLHPLAVNSIPEIINLAARFLVDGNLVLPAFAFALIRWDQCSCQFHRHTMAHLVTSCKNISQQRSDAPSEANTGKSVRQHFQSSHSSIG